MSTPKPPTPPDDLNVARRMPPLDSPVSKAVASTPDPSGVVTITGSLSLIRERLTLLEAAILGDGNTWKDSGSGSILHQLDEITMRLKRLHSRI